MDTDKDNESGDHTGDILLNDDDNATYDSESLRVTRAKVDGGSFQQFQLVDHKLLQEHMER